MFIAVLDDRKKTVDIIKIDDTLVPEMFDEHWVNELLNAQGYQEESTSWMLSDNPIAVNTMEFLKKETLEERRQTALKDGKTPKNWN